MNRLGLMACLLVVCTTVDARADYLTHAARASFEAHTYQREIVTFEGLAATGEAFGYLSAEGLTEKGVTFLGVIPDDFWLFVVDPAVTPEFYGWGTGAVLLGPPSWYGDGSRIEVRLPPGTTAFGTDLMSILPYAAYFDIVLATGETFTAASAEFPQRAFFGITSDAPISSVTFVAGDGALPLLDNFTIGLTAPLPPSLLLAVTGMVGVLGYRYRWSRRRNRDRDCPTKTMPA
jgi:hypothetical protein